MKYILYHSSITGDSSAMGELRKHAQDGEILAEYFDDVSTSEETPELRKALKHCRETGAMLVVLDLSSVNNAEASEREGIQLKRIV